MSPVPEVGPCAVQLQHVAEVPQVRYVIKFNGKDRLSIEFRKYQQTYNYVLH